MPNKFRDVSQAKTLAKATKMSAALTATPAAYGLSALQAAALEGALTTYQAKIDADSAAEQARKVATLEKLQAKNVLTNAMSDLAKIAYAYPAITETALVDADLEIPAKPHPIVLKQPLSLLAETFTNGDVKLTWKANGNPRGVIYQIQISDDLLTWSNGPVTQATRFTLTNFAPGVKKSLRIVATTRGLYSNPSTPTTIYATGTTPVELKIAA